MNRKDVYRTTVSMLLLSALFNGVFTGFTGIQDIIARKAFGALDWQLMVLTMIWPVTNFLSIWWGKILEQSANKSKYFWTVAVFGRLSLLVAYFVTSMNIYLLIYGTVAFFNGLLSPASNSIYQSNLPHDRSKIFGYTMSIASLMSMIFAWISGRFLDSSEGHLRLIFIVVSVCGFISTSLLSYIKIDDNKVTYQKKMRKSEIFFTPLKRAFGLLKTNKPYAHFQRDFTLYGFGFLSLAPVIPIFLVDNLNLSYTHSFVSKGILAQIGFLILSPVFGRLHDNFHPFKFAGYSFGAIALFPLLLIITGQFSNHLVSIIAIYFTFLIYGFAMSGVNMAWNMSSIHFAGNEDASMYQSLHVTITGIRGLFAPVLGILAKNYIGIYGAFFMSFCFFVTASIFSYRDYKAYSSGKLV
jgi:MFS family permease